MHNERVPLYDSFSREYDVMVSWPERLAREWPFLERQLRAVQARRILDVGTGTGKHSLWLAQHGYEVVGTDPSEEMLRQARSSADDAPGVRFIRAGLGDHAAKVGGQFDAIICLGNTVPHVLNESELLSALCDLRAVLRPGGVLVVQILNYDRILAGRQRFLGLSAGLEGPDELLFFRFYDYPEHLEPGSLLTFNVVVLRRTSAGWHWRVDSTRLQPIRSGQLECLLLTAGFGEVRQYGSYAGEAFDRERSNDLIVVARRI